MSVGGQHIVQVGVVFASRRFEALAVGAICAPFCEHFLHDLLV